MNPEEGTSSGGNGFDGYLFRGGKETDLERRYEDQAVHADGSCGVQG